MQRGFRIAFQRIEDLVNERFDRLEQVVRGEDPIPAGPPVNGEEGGALEQVVRGEDPIPAGPPVNGEEGGALELGGLLKGRLVELAEAHGVDASGTRDELIARLEEAGVSADEDAGEE